MKETTEKLEDAIRSSREAHEKISNSELEKSIEFEAKEEQQSIAV